MNAKTFILSIFALAVGAYVAPAYFAHFQVSIGEYAVGEDSSQQLPPIIYWLESQAVLDGYIATYYLTFIPALVKGVYLVGAWFRISVHHTSIVVQYAAFTVTAVSCYLVGNKIGGRICAVATLCLLLTSGLLYNVVGGVPRSFGLPCAAMILWALVSERFALMCILVVLSALLYPIVAVLGGLSLLTWIIADIVSNRARLDDHRLRYRFAAAVIAGVTTLAILLSYSHRIEQQFGPLVTKETVTSYPEAGPGGRSWSRRVFSPMSHLERAQWVIEVTLLFSTQPSIESIRRRMVERAKLWETFVLVTLAAALVVAGMGKGPPRQILWFAIGAALAYVLAEVLDPILYFSQRYLHYSLPLLCIVLAPYLLKRSIDFTIRKRCRESLSWLLFVLVLALAIFGLGGRPGNSMGYFVHSVEEKQLLSFIESLPESSRIAVWPRSRLAISVPLAASRAVLFNDKFHQSFHTEYILEMRRRARAFFTAYLSPSEVNLHRLAADFEVTHVVFDKRHLISGPPPRYFAPFNEQIEALWNPMQSAKFVQHPPERFAIIYDHGPYTVMALN